MPRVVFPNWPACNGPNLPAVERAANSNQELQTFALDKPTQGTQHRCHERTFLINVAWLKLVTTHSNLG